MMVSFRVAEANTAIGFSWHTCVFLKQVLNAFYSKFQASCKAFQDWNYGNIQDVFDTSFRIWKHSARAHESTAQIEGGRQHLRFSENI
jgi:hypothetical protein